MTKPYGPIAKEVRDKFNETGRRIFKLLKEEFPNESIQDLDIILNTHCLALTLLTINHVGRDDFQAYLQLVHKILSSNLKEYENWNPRPHSES